MTGTEAFRLYDTFGFPIDLAEEVALEAGLQLDRQEFEATLEATRQKARETWKGSGEVQVAPVYQRVLRRAGRLNLSGLRVLPGSQSVGRHHCRWSGSRGGARRAARRTGV